MNVHLIRRLKFHNYVFRDRKKWQQNHKEKKGLKTLCPEKGFLTLSRGSSIFLLWAIYSQRLNWVRQTIFKLFSYSRGCMKADGLETTFQKLKKKKLKSCQKIRKINFLVFDILVLKNNFGDFWLSKMDLIDNFGTF